VILKHEVALNGYQTVNIGVRERSTIQYAIYICNLETITNLGTCLLSSGNKQNREKTAKETAMQSTPIFVVNFMERLAWQFVFCYDVSRTSIKHKQITLVGSMFNKSSSISLRHVEAGIYMAMHAMTA